MADPNTLAGFALVAEQQALAVIEEHGTEERRRRIATYFPSPLPNAYTEPQRHSTLQSEIIGGLAEIIGRLAEQQTENAPRGPGRPRKVQPEAVAVPVETSRDASMDRPADNS